MPLRFLFLQAMSPFRTTYYFAHNGCTVSLFISNGTTAWIYSIHIEFWPLQLHQHLHLHSTCHLNNKTYPITPDFHWHQYLHLCYWIHATTTNKGLYHFGHGTLYITTFPLYPLLTTSTLYWIITNTSTTDTTWPFCSLLHYLLPFSTYHIYSLASVLHIILLLIKPCN